MDGMFRALKYRNYRLFFTGQTLSLIGSWMEQLAMSWLVYRITGSPAWLGTVAFASQIPMFLISPFAGVAVDRYDKRRMLLTTQILYTLASATLATLVLGHWIQPWQLLILGVFLGCVSAFDMPVRQALVVQLVEDRENLSNAIALNSAVFNLARLIGPALAGVAIGLVGEGGCFVINSISFLAVIIGILMMRLEKHVSDEQPQRAWSRMKEGARYAWNNIPIRSLLILMAAVSFVSGAYSVLITVYAKDIYHGDEHTLSYLSVSVGVGALVASLALARRDSVIGLSRWILYSAALMSVSLAIWGFTRNVWQGLPILAVNGFAAILQMGSTNTMLQTIAEDQMRGRVMSFYTMSFVGTMPIGSLVAGTLATHVGTQWVLLVAGVIGLISAYFFYRSLPAIRAVLRPVYEAKGILRAT